MSREYPRRPNTRWAWVSPTFPLVACYFRTRFGAWLHGQTHHFDGHVERRF